MTEQSIAAAAAAHESTQISRRTKHATAEAKHLKTQTIRLDAEHQDLVKDLQKARDGASFQQLVEKLLEEEAQRQQQTWGSIAAGFVGNNQELFDKLADL